jgi:hypothetical protein
MKTFILSLALGIVTASSISAYATDSPYHRVHSHYRMVQHAQWYDPFKPRTTNGLSRNRDACASYGCVGAGGGGD